MKAATELAALWLAMASQAAIGLLILAFLLGLWRALRGPRRSDRLLALKHAWLVSIGFMAVMILVSKDWRILDLALALALLGGTVPLVSAWAARRRADAAPSTTSTKEAPLVGDH
jgi:multisubunit Na+/H+ antiporter MnhF subunit